jgi:hypothetical protein
LQAQQLQLVVSAQNPEQTQNIVRLYEKALKAQKAISSVEKEDPVKQCKNEFFELFFNTMIAYLVTLNYLSLKQYENAFAMQMHAMSETQNVLDCYARN